MSDNLKSILTAAAAAAILIVSCEPLFARGGAANIMNSPGYQRRLQESREQLAKPDVQPSSSHRNKRRKH